MTSDSAAYRITRLHSLCVRMSASAGSAMHRGRRRGLPDQILQPLIWKRAPARSRSCSRPAKCCASSPMIWPRAHRNRRSLQASMGHGVVFPMGQAGRKNQLSSGNFRKRRPPPEPGTVVVHVALVPSRETRHESTNRARRLWAWPGYPCLLSLKQERG
jgi:hypothetical protein